MNRDVKKWIGNSILFVGIMFLTFWFVFRGQDLGQIMGAIQKMSPWSLLVAFFLALFFVSAEGWMIWFLLRGLGRKNRLKRCISYSFVGFFFSGITPSATGGQPMQLYYMKKDGNPFSESTVVLMTVALLYKMVLVFCGAFIALFWNQNLRGHLGKFYYLYWIGLLLNIVVVTLLLLVMFLPDKMQMLLLKLEQMLVRIHLFKENKQREEKIIRFVEEYQGAVSFFCRDWKQIGIILIVTFFQRCSVFVLTYVVYLGLGLHGSEWLTVTLLQASVYIAVDMLPIPGAQGITETMYKSIFANIFTGNYLVTSMCVTRGVSFYFVLIVSGVVVLLNRRK